MGILPWLATHWFGGLQTASIVVGLFATVQSIREETRERKVGNLFTVTKSHREIWTMLYTKPELQRVLREDVDVRTHPPTFDEELFVHLLILHVRTSFKARSVRMEFDDDAMAADLGQFFSRPIPKAVWEISKQYQDRQFVEFVDSTLS